MFLSMMGNGPTPAPINIQVITASLTEGNLTLTPPPAPYANVLWAQIKLYAIGAGGGGGAGGPANTVIAGGGGGGGGSGNIVSYTGPYYWDGEPWVQAGLPGDGGNLSVRGGKAGNASTILAYGPDANTITTIATAAGGGGGLGGGFGTGGNGGAGLYNGTAGETVNSMTITGGNGGIGGNFSTYVPVSVPLWAGAGGHGGHGQDKPSGSGNVGSAGNQGWGYYEITYALPS